MKGKSLRKNTTIFFMLITVALTVAPVTTYAAVEWLESIAGKADEISGVLRTKVGVACLTLALIFLGYKSLTGRISKELLMGIIAFAMILTFADKIAEWGISFA